MKTFVQKQLQDRTQLYDVAKGVYRAQRRLRQSLQRAAWHARRRFGMLDRQLSRHYFAHHSVKKLHIGCGANLLAGWLNSDHFPRSKTAIHFDATRRFPFPDQSFDYVYSEHMIEHISYSDGEFMLAECFRVLKPNGRVRITTPDFLFLLKLYQEPDVPLHESYTKWMVEQCTPGVPYSGAVFVVNNFVRDWGHQFIYDEQSLKTSLKQVGFSHVTRHDLQGSDDKHLRDLANEKREPEGFLRLETMTMEGGKLVASSVISVIAPSGGPSRSGFQGRSGVE